MIPVSSFNMERRPGCMAEDALAKRITVERESSNTESASIAVAMATRTDGT
jgi:hypothetical protein